MSSEPNLSASFRAEFREQGTDFPLSACPLRDAEAEKCRAEGLMDGKPEPKAYTLRLEPLPNDRLGRSPLMRLRALLKCALRGYGLRATILKPDTKDPI